MATLHSTITGSENHEPKGVESAAVGTSYVATGSGSGTWTKDKASDTTVLDAANVLVATNVEDALYEIYQADNLIEGRFDNVSAASTLLMPIPFSCTISSITFILAGAITVANDVITVTRSDGAAMGTATIVQSGSAEGTTVVFTPSGNAAFTYPTHKYIKLVNAAGSTGAQVLYVQARIKKV